MKYLKFFEENTPDDFDYFKNLTILKNYVRTLIYERNHESDNISISFLKQLHNYLIIEKKCFDEVQSANLEINKYLNLKYLSLEKDIYDVFVKLYDPEHIIRNNMENFDRLEIIKEILKNEEVFTKLLTEDDVDRMIWEIEAKKYNL